MAEIHYAQLQKKLEEAVHQSLPTGEKVGVAFSGGLDSGTIAFIAKTFSPNVVLLVVGTRGSMDIARAVPLAQGWGVPIHVKELTEGEINYYAARAARVLDTTDFLQVTLGSVNLAIMEWAHAKGIRHVLGGSGADELFAGYAAFEQCRGDAGACEQLRTEKVENVETHDVMREVLCAQEYGITLHAPYLEEEFMKEALAIPAIENLEGKYGEIRKNVLRTLAEKMGVPHAIVSAPKKAMQYGSGVRKTRKN